MGGIMGRRAGKRVIVSRLLGRADVLESRRDFETQLAGRRQYLHESILDVLQRFFEAVTLSDARGVCRNTRDVAAFFGDLELVLNATVGHPELVMRCYRHLDSNFSSPQPPPARC